jgi:hypothetical protein
MNVEEENKRINEEYNNIIINNNNNNNNNIYNNNRVSSIINNTTIYKYINNNKYSSILYLLLKKGYTYFTELKRTLQITSNHHLFKLENDNVVFSRKPTKQEWEFLKLVNNLGEKHKERLVIYELTQEALSYCSQPKVYDMLKTFAQDGLDDFIILQINDFEKKQLEEERQIKLRQRMQFSQGIYSDAEKEEYQQWKYELMERKWNKNGK